ncbi:putative altered inheritance of mitochondria protein 18, mitochondrial [Mollisia scopiformis]|uniref:Putative altered inheritance of mitochondria protein 18, mitochondrial n=1 Tax=Mollisia scopiformis TaxID=149040 RepID=A0A194XMB2_MOLSC|nr:putative altered inheritance of mitochondria protein 18, mitochondrial [Mollisia scopiformis]KUJ21229.1 putative altered inheritance of mitochondria protein 18, mitochondrial [Mollisia scopiformis]
MSLRNPTIRLLRTHIPRPRILRPISQFLPRYSSTRELPSQSNHVEPPPALDPITLHRLEAEHRAYQQRRTYYLSAGVVLGMLAIWITATSIDLETYPPASKLDSGRRSDDPLVVLGRERKVVVQKLGEEPEEKVEIVATGTSYVPTFPRIVLFVDDEREIIGNGAGPAVSDDRLVEYQLLGLGIRTVSFLGVQVYVVGMYVATDDIAALQEALIKKIDPIASTLVAGEKEKLREKLYDPEEGTRIWSEVLRDAGVRSLMRIVPTRNTDFPHLRDGWVRAITARAQGNRAEFGDEAFGKSVADFKALFNRGTVPKQKELLLSRDKQGKLAVWYDDGKVGANRLGDVADERLSRALWLNYLAGKTVASEPARKSIIDGIMEYVERPVGTVATQVHV